MDALYPMARSIAGYSVNLQRSGNRKYLLIPLLPSILAKRTANSLAIVVTPGNIREPLILSSVPPA
jgi:hypothetical protein